MAHGHDVREGRQLSGFYTEVESGRLATEPGAGAANNHVEVSLRGAENHIECRMAQYELEWLPVMPLEDGLAWTLA